MPADRKEDILETLKVDMFGNFSLTYRGKTVSENDKRMRKMWKFVKYLAARRERAVPEHELIDVIGKSENINNPASIKTMLHRVRNIISVLDPELKNLLIHQNGTYYWNLEIPQTTDFDEFHKLFDEAEKCDDPKKKYAISSKALSLYRGYYLGGSFDIPDINATAHECHLIYIKLFDSCAEYLFSVRKYKQVISSAIDALVIDQYQESFYYYLIKALISVGDHKNALSYYNKASEIFYGKFKINLSDRIRALYGLIKKDEDVPPSTNYPTLKNDISPAESENGAGYCEYKVFKFTCSALQKAAVGSECLPYLLLFTAVPKDDSAAPNQKQTSGASERILRTLRACLGSRDIYSKCSAVQYAAAVYPENKDINLLLSRLQKKYVSLAPNSLFALRIDCEPLLPTDA